VSALYEVRLQLVYRNLQEIRDFLRLFGSRTPYAAKYSADRAHIDIRALAISRSVRPYFLVAFPEGFPGRRRFVVGVITLCKTAVAAIASLTSP
jgi:hypothetical protein